MKPGLFSNAWMLLGSSGVTQVAALAAQILIVRLLTLNDYGVYAGALAVCAVAEGVAVARSGEISLNRLPALLHGVSDWPPSLGRVFRWFWREELLFVTGAFAFVEAVGLVYLLSVDSQMGGAIMVMGLAMWALWCYGVWKSLIIVSADISSLSRMEVYASLSTFTVTVVGVATFGFWGLVVAYSAAAALRNLAALLVSHRLLRRAQRQRFVLFETEEARRPKHVHSLLGAALLNLFKNFDLIILSLAASVESVAIYKIAKSLANLGGKFFGPFWNSLRPKWLATLYSADGIALFRMTAKAAGWLGAFAVVAVGFAATFGDDLIPLVYGSNYVAAAPLLLALLVGECAVHALGGWSQLWVVARGDFAVRNLILIAVLAGLLLLGIWLDYSAPHRLVYAYVGMRCLYAASWWVVLAHGTLSPRGRTQIARMDRST